MVPIFLHSLNQWLRRLFSPRHRRTVFVFSDTHFNHKKILRYCNRPFSNIREMNEELVSRWNRVVGEHDHVYFLGDFVFHGSVAEWAGRLNGTIHFIRGNHDHRLHFARTRKIVKHADRIFMLVHDPAHVPPGWDGWVIHGHTHNTRMTEYPFINGKARRINVSAELTDYTPLRLDYLIPLGLDSIQRMETIRSAPVRRKKD